MDDKWQGSLVQGRAQRLLCFSSHTLPSAELGSTRPLNYTPSPLVATWGHSFPHLYPFNHRISASPICCINLIRHHLTRSTIYKPYFALKWSHLLVLPTLWLQYYLHFGESLWNIAGIYPRMPGTLVSFKSLYQWAPDWYWTLSSNGILHTTFTIIFLWCQIHHTSSLQEKYKLRCIRTWKLFICTLWTPTSFLSSLKKLFILPLHLKRAKSQIGLAEIPPFLQNSVSLTLAGLLWSLQNAPLDAH